MRDHVTIELTAPLLDERGVATETIRVANIVPFMVLKALAYDDRMARKDAHDLVYCLMHYGDGPAHVGSLFAERLRSWPNEPLLDRALAILKARFASDDQVSGFRKDGPISYAGFLTDPGRRDLDARNRQDAVAVVEAFLAAVDVTQGRTANP